MTTIVLLIDNSASMSQRTIQGTTFLDVAKNAVELFYKTRLSKSRVDKYVLLTLDSDKDYIKLFGWVQNVDIQSLRAALCKIKISGTVSLEYGIQRAFRILNLYRLGSGDENYAQGILPSYVNPGVILCISDGCCNISDDINCESFPIGAVETEFVQHVLTDAPFRWDYRLYTVVLRFPSFHEFGFSHENITHGNTATCIQMSESSGGKSFIVTDNRELQQCLESIVSKCQSFVIVNFSMKSSSDSSSTIHKEMLYVKQFVKHVPVWPIPETFWPEDDLTIENMPPRPVHPYIFVSPTQEPAVVFSEIPSDKYELEPSSFTNHLLKFDPDKIWPCYGQDKNGKGATIGFLKILSDLETVQLNLLPYNYPVLLNLIRAKPSNLEKLDSWGLQFLHYLDTIPRYYFQSISKKLSHTCNGILKADKVEGALPFSIKHTLQRVKQLAKNEFERLLQSPVIEEIDTVITIPSFIPKTLWPYGDLRADLGTRSSRSKIQPCNRFTDIKRGKLRTYLRKMRLNVDVMLTDGSIDRNSELLYQQPIASMGDYLNYHTGRTRDPLPREFTPNSERLDTFGNPFRKKSNAFVADEVYVEGMEFSNVAGGANASLPSPMRKRNHSTAFLGASRNKGPLPPHINHLNWREFSLNHYPDHSIQNNSFSSQGIMNKSVPTNTRSDNAHQPPMKDVFVTNEELIRDVIGIIREPFIDGQKILDKLGKLCGTIGQKYAAISALMSEALRFKRSSLYYLLKDWCSCILQNDRLPDTERLTKPLRQSNNVQLNGFA